MSSNKFILERSLLRRADILLTGDKSLTSLGIRAATASRYSHAALYIGGTTIEATLDGVFSKSPQRLIFDRATDILVLRAKRPISEEEVNAICDYAQSKVGSLYSVNEAITVRARSLLRHKESERQFCSRLVAKSFEHANFDLINLRNPAFCTPRQLSLCKAFEPVLGVVRPASEAEVTFAMTEDPNQTHQRQTFDWLGKVRHLVSENEELAKKWDIQTLNDVNSFLLAHPEYDQQISEFMQSSGYLEFYKIESITNPHRYSSKLLIHQLRQIEDPGDYIDDELEKEPGLFRRFGTMQYQLSQLYKEKNLNFFWLQIRLYNNMLKEILIRVSVVRDTYLSLRMPEEAQNLNSTIEAVASVVRQGQELLDGHRPI
ncbi:YiiX/YebB-like N1pC/P60 family cysteine hydrolase [Pseudomonas plecoglossicida]|uniref:YiiX/YebB-like N1pC/P60 family cysteine hydrolase n=1 Tax=Pseudomonas TaxID=286 RepID=UPI001463FD0C|nr:MULTISPECIES: YiiX/YebB-like N1pC/P60 family cysteine hydrolase [Pseudomonas]MDQ7966670.1 YiiX/YebB-like N1pC/P60 family cysteine hydrolase [Pseudomonas plecoglossicida]QJQ22925.1 hypothetical protein HG549_24320 [Pseudomonas sp. SK]UPK88518.1 hypothetical protein E5221_27705 [Pseudomonas sp. A2]WFG02780.1 YiiX/YebB-like N1pC/P60 family cysteine hydrolase [Pseudomonas putida]